MQYNKALGAWRQATVKVIQAEGEVKSLNTSLKNNDRDQIKAETELAAAKADPTACAGTDASSNGPLAPLVDCAKEQGKVNKAEQNLATLEAKHQQMEEQLRSKEQEVEDLQDAAVKAHAAEQAAWAALNEAKAAAPGCKEHKA